MTNAELYLDYLNNFITVVGFAEHYGYTKNQAINIIELGKSAHEANVRSIKS